MSLLFNTNTEDVDHGNNFSLIDPHTIIILQNPTNVDATNRQIAGHAVTGGNHRLISSITSGAGRVRYFAIQSGGLADANAVTGTLVVNTWQWIVARYDASDSQFVRLYRGTLTSPIAEVSYDSTTNGGGTILTASPLAFTVGADPGNSIPYEGRIAWIGVWPGTALTLGQMIQQQWRPHVTAGCELMTWYGFNGVGTQPDLSGNGSNGTVTGATVADHAGVGPPFGFDIPWAPVAVAAPSGANPHNPLGHPLYGPLAGPVAA